MDRRRRRHVCSRFEGTALISTKKMLLAELERNSTQENRLSLHLLEIIFNAFKYKTRVKQ